MQSGAIRPIPNMLPRQLFNEEHEAFRETVRKFYEKEVIPNIEKYEKQQHVDRDLWNISGELGLL
jgi:long-chain-acyl-CoA dehydrogenase